MAIVKGKLKEVQVGDVMYRGVVSRVGEARRTRSGRMLMVIAFDRGTHEDLWAVDPETDGSWDRPE